MVGYVQMFDSPNNITGKEISKALNFINSLYAPKTAPVGIEFLDGLGKVTKGIYKRFHHKGITIGIIFLDANISSDDFINTLIDEYTHHITQQDHGYILYELFYEWFIDKYIKEVKV